MLQLHWECRTALMVNAEAPTVSYDSCGRGQWVSGLGLFAADFRLGGAEGIPTITLTR